MIKYLGAVGTFIRLNDSVNATYKLLNIFSSSAASDLLFSASINNSTGLISYNNSIASLYVNGVSGSAINNQQWNHITFSFNTKLKTLDYNNFLIRFGDTASSNFNIQNLYILENSFKADEIKYLHQEFTGYGESVIRVNDSASFSLGLTDSVENNFTDSETGIIYQPIRNQKRFLCNVSAVSEKSLTQFVSASVMKNDDLYVDSFNIQPGNKIFSYADQQIYQLTASSKLTTVSSSVGDFIRVLSGRYYGGLYLLKTSASFQITPASIKLNTYVNRKQ